MSYENHMKESLDSKNKTEDRIEISLLKYLWDAGPLSTNKSFGYHEFFKRIKMLNSFSDNEIRIFTKFLHRREFEINEVIFKEGDSGYGFYFIFSGRVNIFSNPDHLSDTFGDLVVSLEKGQYFGEMGLMEEFNRRTATAVASENTILLGFFKPDLEKMLEQYPVLGAKFLRETALILANRMGYLTREVTTLRKKIINLEKSHEA